ncbi:MAG TPA: hypothetical protein PLZ21_10630 [Armatimonadota bacterium]|nr:hypothetical protein [Armatimonadota bacterium]
MSGASKSGGHCDVAVCDTHNDLRRAVSHHFGCGMFLSCCSSELAGVGHVQPEWYGLVSIKRTHD